MDVVWIQLVLISGVLGMIIVGTFYFWRRELLNALLVEDKEQNDRHSLDM